MAKSYVVTGPLATPYAQDGSRAYLYQGSAWPTDLREGETERFLDLKLISEVNAPDSDKEPAGYQSLKVDDLKAEISKRNDGREEADQISLEGNKSDLIAALKADDSK